MRSSDDTVTNYQGLPVSIQGYHLPGVSLHVFRNQREGKTCKEAVSGTPIKSSNPDQDVFRRILGILNKDIKVPVIIKNTGIKQLIFRLIP